MAKKKAPSPKASKPKNKISMTRTISGVSGVTVKRVKNV